MMGESPSLPTILKKRPEVVVTPEISPRASMALQLIVPYVRTYSFTSGGHSDSGGADPVCLGGGGWPPPEPDLRDPPVRTFLSLDPCQARNSRAPPATNRAWSLLPNPGPGPGGG